MIGVEIQVEPNRGNGIYISKVHMRLYGLSRIAYLP